MGRVKNYLMEQEAQWASGFLPPESGEKYVCASHFENLYLKRFIAHNACNGTCSYCGKKDKVVDLADFVEYVGNRLTSFLGPIENEDMYLASSFLDKEDREEGIPGWKVRGLYLAPEDAEYYEDVGEVLMDYDLVTDNNDLNEDIESCFNINQWIRKDPTSALMKDDLLQSWKNFSHLVKTKMRYTFFRCEEYYTGSGFVQGMHSDIIAEVSGLVRLLECILPVGTRLYRGRPEDDQAPFTAFASMTAPPAESAKENRMSPYGISMFYGSFDPNTPTAEIRNYSVEKSRPIYLGIFEVKRPLRVINLCNIPTPNFWMDEKDDWQRYAFLRNFHNEISQPTDPDKGRLDYIPSQVFCEYLRFIQKASDGNNYDGIIYKSALTKEQNIALFYDNKSSAEILDLKKISKI